LRSERLINRWVGVGLTQIAVVATIWLSVTGRLTLYIHPRYTVFTTGMAVIGGIIVSAAIVVASQPRAADDHDHDHDELPSARTRVLSWSRLAILVLAMVALLVVPPATLSSTTRQNRELVTSGQALDAPDTRELAGRSTANFTVKDWAALLSYGGPEAVLGEDVDLSGYVLDQGEDDVFFVVRMIVSCCAVDAQPIGVPVYRPGWRAQLKPSTWIALKGTFIENTDQASDQQTVIRVASLSEIDEPDQPYVF